MSVSYVRTVSITFTLEIWNALEESRRRRSKQGKYITIQQLVRQFVRDGLNAEAEAERAADEARRAENEFRRATSAITSPYREVGISSLKALRDRMAPMKISETRYAIPASGEDLRHTLERLKREEESE